MSVEELYKNGCTILPNIISENTCDSLKLYLDQKFNLELPYNYSEGINLIIYKLKFDSDAEEIFYDAPFSTWNLKF